MDNAAVKLAPSILAADFARLDEQVAEAERAGADRIHVDVMDGHFVPNLSMGPAIVQSLRRVTHLTLETHLMISDPAVNPGFGHQQFLRSTLPKIQRIRELVEQRKPRCEVEVDGGIDATTAPLVVRAGATVLVAGSAIFGEREGVSGAMSRLRRAVEHHERNITAAERSAA
jgi:ribulose-phosphate 3-epimerase